MFDTHTISQIKLPTFYGHNPNYKRLHDSIYAFSPIVQNTLYFHQLLAPTPSYNFRNTQYIALVVISATEQIQQLPTQKTTTFSTHFYYNSVKYTQLLISSCNCFIFSHLCAQISWLHQGTPTSSIKSSIDISSTLYINNKTLLHSFACTFEVDRMMAKTKKKTIDEKNSLVTTKS